MLNPNLDRYSLAAEFAEDGRIRIRDILDPSIAERLLQLCDTAVPFEYLTHVDGDNLNIPPDALTKLTTEQLTDMQERIKAGASQGIGFFYAGYQIERRLEDDSSEDLQFLHSLFDFLNGEELLQFIRDVTGYDDIRSADAQYTRYTQGQFLTRHLDDITDQERRVAYVISLSKDWHPDWGGLLQFFENDGTTRESWAPIFNAMSLFDVRHVHSVTYVTPFAPKPRYSLTGWFRAVDW